MHVSQKKEKRKEKKRKKSMHNFRKILTNIHNGTLGIELIFVEIETENIIIK